MKTFIVAFIFVAVLFLGLDAVLVNGAGVNLSNEVFSLINDAFTWVQSLMPPM